MFKRVVHPGDVLREELEELGTSPATFARQIDVPLSLIHRIIAGEQSVTGDTALKFGHWFGVAPQFWMNLQTLYDLVEAKRKVGETVRAKHTYIKQAKDMPLGKWLVKNTPRGTNLEIPSRSEAGREIPFIGEAKV